MTTRNFGMALERVVSSRIAGSRPDCKLVRNPERVMLARMEAAVKLYASTRPRARTFTYHGRRFWLERFDGWLIVMTRTGVPIVGPVRVMPMRRKVAA